MEKSPPEYPIDRHLAAIVVADVVGYSGMMALDEAGTLRALVACREKIVAPIIERHGGRIVKLLGDGLLIEFVSVINAVKCSIVIQNQIRAMNDSIPEGRKIVFRIGINYGDIIAQDGDIYGDGVNIAARLEPHSQPGGICVSGKVFDEVTGKIDVAMHALEPLRLKNIPNATRAYAIEPSGAHPQSTSVSAPTSGIHTAREFTTLAVLPFSNLSGSKEHDYFVDGLTDDLTTELCRNRNLSVVARGTAFAYKGQSVNAAELGRKFGADIVVTGGVRLGDGRIRATVQLVDTQTGNEVFSERFDNRSEDVFTVQDEIVDCILGRLFFNLQAAAGAVRSRNATDSVSAYTSWLRAGDAWRNGDEAGARLHMHDAVEIDPVYPPALASLSLMYGYWRFSEASRQTDDERKHLSLEYASRALVKGKSDPFVLSTVAVSFLLAGATRDAVRHSEVAVALSPRDTNVQIARGMILSFAGRHDEGLSLVQHACSFEPLLPPTAISSLGDCLFLSRQFEAALDAYRSLMDPPFFFRLNEAACLTHLGRAAEAVEVLRGFPLTFDTALYAENSAAMCALPDDAEIWRYGLRGTKGTASGPM
jgi:adenylate cyclase